MMIEINLGWWIAPMVVTAAVFIWAYIVGDVQGSGDYGHIGAALANLVVFGVALIVTLFAWLVWAVFA
jgi:hypothetical protein